MLQLYKINATITKITLSKKSVADNQKNLPSTTSWCLGLLKKPSAPGDRSFGLWRTGEPSINFKSKKT